MPPNRAADPRHPILFIKVNSAIVGPNDDVEMPRGSTATDWEVELGVVIGTKAKYVTKADALKHVAGYCVINDVSERDYPAQADRPVDQGQVLRHVRPDRPVAGDRRRGFRSAGARPLARRQWRRRQTGTTAKMIFDVATIIEHLSD
jgi:2-keto-4-pentenoate hydratase/2-oxohepta-3-ene-1,7-dioic acid hydratase in catechol pathway